VTTPGSTQPLPFVAKFSANGDLVCSYLFSSGIAAQTAAIAVDSKGGVIVTGQSTAGSFPSTPSSYSFTASGDQAFITKVDATGTKVLFPATGVGGSDIALDPTGDIVVAGNTISKSYPAMDGAYQTTFKPASFCAFPCQLPLPASEQYVSKLSADGTKLIFSTFLTGSGGSQNMGLAVDASGDAWVTGETASADYPYTVAASADSQPDTFTTELDPTGSRVILSVQHGGSGIAFDPAGNVLLAGSFGTPFMSPIIQNIAIPGPPPTGNTPPQCLPGSSGFFSDAFALRISGGSGNVLGAKIMTGTSLTGVSIAVDAQGSIYLAGLSLLPDVALSPGVIFSDAVALRTVPVTFLARIDLSESAVGCVTDSSSFAPNGPVAPGQLLTIFGKGIGPVDPAVGLPESAT
jgi:hypothetical protein